MKISKKLSSITVACSLMISSNLYAGVCQDVTYAEFQAAVEQAYLETNQFGFGLPMWATLMGVTGEVCYVTSVKGGMSPTENTGFTASNNAWLGSRVISAQKANTANAFSLRNLAISTGALSAAVYPGGSLYGLQFSNPVDPTIAYAGDDSVFGSENDPLVGTKPGGVNVFGGGVALYGPAPFKAGAVGVSGDTSCRDHAMAYRLRAALGYDNQPNDDGLALVDSPTALFQQPACGVADPTSSSASGAPTAANDFGVR